MTPHPKLKPIRDRAYLDDLRTQPCIITGLVGENVDPCHIGTLGRGIKSGDDECLPMAHRLHMTAHALGEMTFFRNNLPDSVLRAALRAYAREQYQKWLANK